MTSMARPTAPNLSAAAAVSDSLGTLIRRTRENLGLSRKAVGERGAVSAAYLRKLEADQVASPSPHRLQGLAEILGLKPAVLWEAAGFAGAKQVATSPPATVDRTFDKRWWFDDPFLVDQVAPPEWMRDSRMAEAVKNLVAMFERVGWLSVALPAVVTGKYEKARPVALIGGPLLATPVVLALREDETPDLALKTAEEAWRLRGCRYIEVPIDVCRERPVEVLELLSTDVTGLRKPQRRR